MLQSIGTAASELTFPLARLEYNQCLLFIICVLDFDVLTLVDVVCKAITFYQKARENELCMCCCHHTRQGHVVQLGCTV